MPCAFFGTDYALYLQSNLILSEKFTFPTSFENVGFSQ